ncbi:helix-turn-helix domain-containing protein [Kribbella solani]|uniref:AraC-like DNA-binding protein n=1 Tax=Kribbella solani TaxID=236067 RepID=A0A841DJG2_9ACTN|nr:AraC-like DNA-binding protein [Kribbella solani]
MEYVSRVPRPPLDGLIDDLYYLEGTPPYARLMLPPMPGALLIVILGDPFRIRGGADLSSAEYADGCVITTPSRALEFGYPLQTRSVGVHVKAWGLAPFLPMPAAELCDRPVTIEQVWGRAAVAELQDRLAAAGGPDEMLTVLEDELMRRLTETAGLALVRHTSSVIAATVLSIDPAEPIDWGDVAGGAGYFDQAHFSHEFRAFTGLTPTQYVEVRRRFLREHPGHVLDNWPVPIDFLQEGQLARRQFEATPTWRRALWAR